MEQLTLKDTRALSRVEMLHKGMKLKVDPEEYKKLHFINSQNAVSKPAEAIQKIMEPEALQ